MVETSVISAPNDASTNEVGARPGWQKIPETPPVSSAAFVSSVTVSMGDRETVLFYGSSAGRIWSYRFAQNDWVSGLSGLQRVPAEAGLVWMGTRLLFWSGLGGPGGVWELSNQGGLYDPATDTWSPVDLVGVLPLAVSGSAYTGQEAFMYGRTAVAEAPPSGIFYNPSTDRWRAPPAGIPDAFEPAIVGVGSKIIVWGGFASSPAAAPTTPVGKGAVYDAVSDAWTPMVTENAPSARAEMVAFAAHGQAFVWGGTDNTSDSLGTITFRDGAMYDPARDRWTPISTANSAVRAQGGVWAEEQGLAYVWSGQDSPGVKLWSYSPATDTWASVDVTDLPAIKNISFHWTGSRLLVLGLVDVTSADDAAASDARLTGYLMNP